MMQPLRDCVRSGTIISEDIVFELALFREDLSMIYPGMMRYTVTATADNTLVATFRTNSYELLPACTV
ncbi:MAG: hypothetical protein JXA44_05085 [Methanospirillaceae archaeon]|nr:hypothetical protein [Methanospirillaceae archaeon]